MKNILFFLIWLLQSILGQDIINLLNDQKQYACFSQNSYDSFSGANLFSSISNDINSIAITGWAFFNGYGPVQNGILQIKVDTTPIVDFTYNQDIEFGVKFLGQLDFSSFSQKYKLNAWQYFLVYLESVDLSGQIQYNLQIKFFYTDNQYDLNDLVDFTTFTINKNGFSNLLFEKSKLMINIGGSDYFSQCCCQMKQVKLFWNIQIADLKLFELLNDHSISPPFIQFYSIDFQGNFDKKGYLFNQGAFQDKINLPYQNYDPSILSSQELFFLDRFNPQSNGITISFYFRITEVSTYSTTIIKVQNNIKYDKIVITPNNTLIIHESTDTNPTFFFQFQQQEWIQLIMVYQIKLNSQVYLIIRSKNYNQVYKCKNQNIQYYYQYSITFGETVPHKAFQIAYIDIYEGAYLSSTQLCNYQIHLQDLIKCLQCKDDYLLDRENNNICVPADLQKPSSIIGVKDRVSPYLYCHEDFIEDKKKNQCVCRSQYYLKNGNCIRCPLYCDGCIDQNTCVKGGEGRINGVCQNGTFDDGFSCLEGGKYYLLPSMINRVYAVSYLNYDPSCTQTVSNQDFLYDKSNQNLILNDGESFFFGFTMALNIPIPDSVISYFKNNGQIAFSIQYSKQIDWEYIQLIDQNNSSKLKYRFNSQLQFWVGIWTDLQKVTFFFYNDGIYFTQTVQLGLSKKYINPQLCIGPCSFSQKPYFCGTFYQSKATIIINLSLPVNQQDYYLLFKIIEPFNQIQQYYFYDYQDPQKDTQALEQISQQYSFSYSISQVQNDKFKGFAYSLTSSGLSFSAKIQITYLHFLSFSCSIYINTHTKRAQFKSIGYFDIYLIPHESVQASYIQICYKPLSRINKCMRTQKCLIPFQTISHLFIIHNLKCQYCVDVNSQEFTVVANYCQETLTFYNLFTYQQQTQITFGYLQYNDLIYFNHLYYYGENGFFYFSYDQTDKCFIYIDLRNLKCVYLKQNYYTLGDKIVSKEECLSYNYSLNVLVYINEYSKQCIITQIQSDSCVQIDLENSKCLKCRDIHKNQDDFCLSCIDGYFFNQLNECEPCHFKCSKCQNSYDNCLTCRYQNSQSPPVCECFPSQFVDKNQQCTNCSKKCLSCQDSPDQCTSCNNRRVNPPTCHCDQKFYFQTDNCEDDIICDQKCYACQDLPTQCTLCKQGRHNPPQCDCFVNYYPTSNGECLPCQEGYYFDSQTISCEQCDKKCLKCENSKNNCTGCSSKQYLVNNKCVCYQGSNAYLNGQYACIQNMSVELEVKLIKNYYYLQFTFEHDIITDYFKDLVISDIISLYFYQIPSNTYYLQDFYVDQNKLLVQIKIERSFQTLEGRVYFKQPYLFVDSSLSYVLDSIYQTQSFKINIGPFLFTKNYLEDKIFDQILQYAQDIDSGFIYYAQQFQLVLYFLNTVQPTAMILLYNAQLPPNLYKLCQLYGIFIFPYVRDYGIHSYKKDFQLFRLTLQKQDIQLSSNQVLKKLGFSTSLLVNIQFIFAKQLILFFLILILVFAKFKIPKILKNYKQALKKIIKLQYFLINKFVEESEINLLLVFLSVADQFEDFEDQSWSKRYGIYISILQVSLIAIQALFILKYLFKQKNFKKMKIFTARINTNQNFLSKYYFFIQMIKKYLILVIKYFLFESYIFVGISVGLIFFVSCLATYVQKPYTNVISRSFKILGELILSVIWVLLIFIRVQENKMQESPLISTEQINVYLTYGSIVSILIIVFNLLFLLEFISPIFRYFYNLISQKKQENLNKKKLLDMSLPSPEKKEDIKHKK